MEGKIEQILFEHSYDLHDDQERFEITSEGDDSTISIILWIVGLCLLILGPFFFIGLLFLGLILIFIPVRYEIKKPPKQITFWKKDKTVECQYDLLGRRTIPYEKIQEIVAAESKETNFSSPFRDGNKKFNYEFLLKLTSGQERKILRIQFNKEQDRSMQELAYSLNVLIGTH